jgi:hypothetical protein
LDGAILTGVFGLVCLATPRPLMRHFALTSNGGTESPRGREFADRWRYAFRRVFVVMTVVWGVAFVVRAAINVATIEATSTEEAFVIKILPYLVLAGLGAWTFVYGVRAKRRGEAAYAAGTAARSEQQDSLRVPDRGHPNRQPARKHGRVAGEPEDAVEMFRALPNAQL